MQEQAIKLFNYFHKAVFNQSANFSGTERQLKSLNNFLKLVSDYSERDLYEYVCFQFFRVHEQDTQMGKVQFNWVFGKKALKYFHDRSDAQVYYMRLFRQKYNIKNIFEKPVVLDTRSYNDYERGRFYNTEKGFLHCQSMRLYNESNDYCVNCKFKNICDG